MKQQVNLHQPMFRRRRALFSAAVLVRLAAMLVLVLAAIYAVAYLEAGLLHAQYAKLERERDTVQRQLEAASLHGAGQVRSELLEQEVARLRVERAQKAGALQVLAGGSLGIVEGFSPFLEALARRRVPGLWLTSIRLTEGGRQVQLNGVTIEEALLTRYLRELSEEEIFRGLQFRSAAITRTSGATDEMTFELRTDVSRGTG